MAAAGRSQADVALCSVAVSVLSSLVWNLGEWLILPVLLEPPHPPGYSGQWAGPGLGRGLASHPSSVTPCSGPWVPPVEGASQAPMGSGVRAELGCGVD